MHALQCASGEGWIREVVATRARAFWSSCMASKGCRGAGAAVAASTPSCSGAKSSS